MPSLTADQKQACKDLFAALDTDGSGQLDAADIKALLDGADDDTIKEVVTELLEAATDGDGKVSLAEFLSKIESLDE